MIQFYNVCWFLLAQTQVTGGGATPAADAATEATEKPGFFENMGFMFPALMAVMLLYFIMMSRPQPKAAAKTSELLATLKKNDRVVTAGGILGTVVNVRADAEYVTIRIDDSSNARMQVLASSIVRVVSDKEDEK
jgi:preprotein translocase subunit YajC